MAEDLLVDRQTDFVLRSRSNDFDYEQSEILMSLNSSGSDIDGMRPESSQLLTNPSSGIVVLKSKLTSKRWEKASAASLIEQYGIRISRAKKHELMKRQHQGQSHNSQSNYQHRSEGLFVLLYQ